MQPREISGQRATYVVVATAMAVAGVVGAILGVILPARNDVTAAELGPLSFPITPLTFSVYGMVAIGVTLGVVIGLVRFASQYDDATKTGEPTAGDDATTGEETSGDAGNGEGSPASE